MEKNFGPEQQATLEWLNGVLQKILSRTWFIQWTQSATLSRCKSLIFHIVELETTPFFPFFVMTFFKINFEAKINQTLKNILWKLAWESVKNDVCQIKPSVSKKGKKKPNKSKHANRLKIVEPS